MGPYQSEETTLSSIWQICHEDGLFIGDKVEMSEKYNIGNTANILHASDATDLNRYQSQGIKLQHFLSQKYLFPAPAKDKFVLFLGNHTLKPVRKQYEIFRFEPLLSNLKKLVDRKSYVLRTNNDYIMKADKYELERKLIDRKRDAESDSVFLPLEDKDVDESNRL